MNRQRYLEVWSPLRWVQVRFFVSDEGDWFVKIRNHHRTKISYSILSRAVVKRWLWRVNSKGRLH